MRPHKIPREGWTLEKSLMFCRALADHMASHGFAIGLTGSVLTKGRSTKDIDIVVYPMNSARAELKDVHAGLRSFGMRRALGSDGVQDEWRKKGSEDKKHVEVWGFSGRRVDVFFLR